MYRKKKNKIISLIICFALFTLYGCDKRTDEEQNQYDTNSKQLRLQYEKQYRDDVLEKDQEYMQVKIWKDIAKEKGLNQADTNEVADILTEVLDFAIDKREKHPYQIKTCIDYALSCQLLIS